MKDDLVDRKAFVTKGLASLRDAILKSAAAYVAGFQETLPAPILRTRIRPPGAVLEPLFVSRCTSCGDCAVACPYEALKPDDAGRPWLWDPAGHPCYMCEGYPCIAACGTGALTFRDRTLRIIGLAEIAPDPCLAYQGEACTACRDVCRDVKAIDLVAGLPEVDSGRCTGCGLCVGACPVKGSAIGLTPART